MINFQKILYQLISPTGVCNGLIRPKESHSTSVVVVFKINKLHMEFSVQCSHMTLPNEAFAKLLPLQSEASTKSVTEVASDRIKILSTVVSMWGGMVLRGGGGWRLLNSPFGEEIHEASSITFYDNWLRQSIHLLHILMVFWNWYLHFLTHILCTKFEKIDQADETVEILFTIIVML